MGISTLWGERSEQAVDTAAVAGDSATLTCGATKEGKARGKNWREWLPAPERK